MIISQLMYSPDATQEDQGIAEVLNEVIIPMYIGVHSLDRTILVRHAPEVHMQDGNESLLNASWLNMRPVVYAVLYNLTLQRLPARI